MKIAYSKEDAIEAIKKSILKFEVPLKSYKCPFCKKYHLKKKKKQKLIQLSNGQIILKKHYADLLKYWEELGFSQVGVSSIDLTHAEPGLTEWLEKGFHGEMEYMSRHGLTRARPAELIRGTLSVITARMNYLPSDTSTRDLIWIQQERDRLAKVDEGVISVYARGRDYHKVLRQRLDKLAH